MNRRSPLVTLAAALAGVFASVAVAMGGAPYLSLPEPPDGFVMFTVPIAGADGAAPIGRRVMVQREGAPGAIVISVMTAQDSSERSVRVALAKEFVDGMVDGLRDAGFVLVAGTPPDFERTRFAEPVQSRTRFAEPQRVDLAFRGKDGQTLHTRQIIFFTTSAYCVQIAAPTLSEVERLTEWARHVRPSSAAAATR